MVSQKILGITWFHRKFWDLHGFTENVGTIGQLSVKIDAAI